jgi:hypothetical protein
MCSGNGIRAADNESDGTLLFYRFLLSAGAGFQAIGGYAIPSDEHKPLDHAARLWRSGKGR